MAPQDQTRAKLPVVIDPTSPRAGNGGVISPAPLFQPGRSGNPGGRPKGADVGAAILRRLAKNPDADGIGEGARELADALCDVATGKRDPSSIDSKVGLALVDRASGPVVKEINQQTTLAVESIELRERDAPVPLPAHED